MIRSIQSPQELYQRDEGHQSEKELQLQLDQQSLQDTRSLKENSAIKNSENVCEEESFHESTQSSEVEEELEDVVLQENGWIADPATMHQEMQEISTENGLVLPTSDLPEFGDVCITNSSNVHLGNKTFYKGPVTIKQIIYGNSPSPTDSADDVVNKKQEINLETKINDNQPADSYFVYKNNKKVNQCLSSWKLATIFCTIALFILAVTVISIVIITRNTNQLPDLEIPDYTDGINGEPVLHSVHFVTRTEWGAQPPSAPIDELQHPVPYVMISHTASDFCYTQAKCVLIVRVAQTFHMSSREWSDIGYSFLVGGDGLVYVGRAWNFVGAHTFNYNNISIGISFIGTFITKVPTPRQLDAAQKLIELGVKIGKIAPNYKLMGHCQLAPTESPGAALYAIIKKWPHWSEHV